MSFRRRPGGGQVVRTLIVVEHADHEQTSLKSLLEQEQSGGSISYMVTRTSLCAVSRGQDAEGMGVELVLLDVAIPDTGLRLVRALRNTLAQDVGLVVLLPPDLEVCAFTGSPRALPPSKRPVERHICCATDTDPSHLL